MTPKGRAEWYLFATTFIWGGTFVIVKVGLNDVSPFLMVALRFSLAALLLLPFCLRPLARLDRPLLWTGFRLGFLIFLGFIFQTAGLNDTTASKSAFITSMMVVFTPFFQMILLKKRPRRHHLIGVALVSVGLWFLTAPSGGGFNRGDLLTLLCAIVFGLYLVALDIASRRHEILPLTFVQMLAPALYSWGALPFFERPFLIPTGSVFFALGYTAILATVVTGYIQTRYQRDTTPTRAALIFSIEPLWAAILGFLFLGEALGAWGILGGALILGGILFSELSDVMGARLKKRWAPAPSDSSLK